MPLTIKQAQNSVAEFMRKAGQVVRAVPTVLLNVCEKDLRINLHEEEAVIEYRDAQDAVQVADSLADSLVVILGTACAHGIDIEPIFEAVMRSNMSKFIDGYQREDGKWMKGPSWIPDIPVIAGIIAEQQSGANQP